MTSNALRAQELREQKRANRAKEEQEARKDETTRRGQNLKLGADIANFIGGTTGNVVKALNDYKWYVRDDAVGKGIASLPWGVRTGSPISLPGNALNTQPGILRLDVAPGVGVATSAFAGINIAARQLFVQNRSQNTSYTTYEPVDYMMYNVVLGNIYAAYGLCSLILGLLQTYSVGNAYLPKGVLASMGVDFDDFISKIPTFRTWLNNFGRRVEASFPAPANIAYFKRMLQVFSHIYIDSEDDKGQIYYVFPYGFQQWDEVNGSTKFRMMPKEITVTTLTNFIESLYGSLALMESANIMAGDTRKAFGDNVFKFPEFDDTHRAVPERDELMLEQIRNASLLTGLGDQFGGVGGLAITQDNGQIDYQPFYTAPYNVDFAPYLEAMSVDRELTMSKKEPTFADVLDASRFVIRTSEPKQFSAGGTTLWRVNFETCGTEIPVECYVFVGNGTDSVTGYRYAHLGNAMSITSEIYKWLAVLKNFKYAPCVDLCVSESNAVDGNPEWARFINIDNWTVLPTNTLKFMNDSIMLDEFSNRQ